MNAVLEKKCFKMAIVKDSIVEENLLISFGTPPKEKSTLFEEIDALCSEPVCSLKQVK